MKVQLIVGGVSFGDIEITDSSVLGLLARGEFGAASTRIQTMQADLAQIARERAPERAVRGDEIVFDPLTRMVRGPGGRQLLRPLAKRQAAFLGALLRTGRISRQELSVAIWGQRPPVDTNYCISSIVTGLRERLEEIDAGAAIATIHGYGYALRTKEVNDAN